MNIGILGLGTIASAVVHGIAQDGHVIRTSQRSAAQAERLSAQYANVTPMENQEVIDQSDVIFLGLMPERAQEILPQLRFRSRQQVISFMASLSLEDVQACVAPATASCIMIPFPAIAQGGSVIPVLGQDDMVHMLFGTRNQVISLKTRQEMDALLCAQAVLSPVTQLVASAAQWLEENGLEAQRGEPFLRMLIASGLMQSEAKALLTSLATPGGFNESLREHMNDAGMREDLREGLDHLLAWHKGQG